METHPADDQAPKPEPEAKPAQRPAASRLPSWAVSLVILFVAAGIFLLVYGNWNEWESGKTDQTTNDAYVRADVTALSTKATGLLARIEVAEYQHKAGQLIASLRNEDYKAQSEAAQAALEATEAGLEEIRRQEEAADSKITQAQAGVSAAQSQNAAAQAGVAAAQSTVRTTGAGLTGVRAQFQNASQEIERQ
jgi:membrane fusion protein (multidrug efflux system)